MPELRSALATHLVPGRFGAAGERLVLSERPLGTLIQLSGWHDSFESAARPLMARLGFDGIGAFDRAQASDKALAFRIAPERVLLRLTSADDRGGLERDVDPAQTPLLDLSHSRTVLRLSGVTAPELLARLMPIDFDPQVFTSGRFVQSGIHSTGVLVHRAGGESDAPVFDIYMPRSFAVSLWGFITQTAMPFGYRVDAGG
ncbi:MAG: sarcosine oxidase subunit gamma [Pseudolabrys sp.]